MKRTLIFVYNAKSDVWNKSIDFAHKIISPSTYSCNLCSLTHDNFSERKNWRDFREKSEAGFEFVYKDKFLKEYGKSFGEDFPMIFEQIGGELCLLFDSSSIKSMASTEQLIKELGGAF